MSITIIEITNNLLEITYNNSSLYYCDKGDCIMSTTKGNMSKEDCLKLCSSSAQNFEVLCLYPTDASSDGRYPCGCGASNTDFVSCLNLQLLHQLLIVRLIFLLMNIVNYFYLIQY